MKRLTRRDLFAGSALAITAMRVPAVHAQQATSAEDWAKAAREANSNNAQAISKIALPMSTEPAFQFKA